MKKIVIILSFLLVLGNITFAQEMGAPIRVASTTNGARWAQVTFGPDGIAHIIWEEDLYTGPGHEIMYVSYDGTKASKPINLKGTPNERGERPYIHCGLGGVIAVVWGQDDRVHLRVYDPKAKAWLAEEIISSYGYGSDEPCVAVDAQGNIYTWWYSDGGGRIYSRAKINGVWEDVYRLSTFSRATQGGIVVGSDGQVWAVWREKEASGEYKNLYSKRTKTTPWTSAKRVNDGGASVGHPHVGIGPDNIPVIASQDIDESAGNNSEVFICVLDEKANPRYQAMPLYLQHYPRIAIDLNGYRHIAVQIGGGDYGDGIRYTNNIGTGSPNTFKEPITFPAGWPKLPGIAAEAYGNVAVVWSSMFGEDGTTGIWFASLEPVIPKYFYPPINLSSSISVKNLKKNLEVTYNLTWQSNPENRAEYLQGYNIYKKEGSGDFELLTSLSKQTFSATFTFTDLTRRVQFALTTVSLSGSESDMVVFGQ